MRGKGLLVLVCSALIALLTGCGLRNEWAEADKLFREKKYAEAAEAYIAAAKQHPDRRELEFNAACAHHAAGNLDEAIRRFQKLARETTGQLQQKSEYNTGNGYLQQGKAEEAVEHYKRALYLQSDDIDAKWNLELAQRKQSQQQEQQQTKGKEKENKQQQQQQQQQQPQQQQPQQQQPQQQQPQQQQPQQQQQRDQQDQQEDQPGQQRDKQPRQGDMSQKEAERLLSGLSEEDKQLQRSLRKPKEPISSMSREKDW